MEQKFFDRSGLRQRMDVISGGSYLSSSDLRPHFAWFSKKIDSIELTGQWVKQMLDVTALIALAWIASYRAGRMRVAPSQDSSSPASKPR